MSSVFPGVALVLANFLLLVSILMRLDLPTFERPMKAYSGFVSLGHIDTMGAESVNSACLISIHFLFGGQRYKEVRTIQNKNAFFCFFSNYSFMSSRFFTKSDFKICTIRGKCLPLPSNFRKTCFRP